MKAQPESIIREELSWYLRNQYPGVIARFDTASDLKLTMMQAIRQKRLNPHRGFPDLLILEPRGEYHALAVELKAGDVTVFKADGTLRADKHLEEQQVFLEWLRSKGYMAVFAVGLAQAIDVIDAYMDM